MRPPILAFGAVILFLSTLLYAIPLGESGAWAVSGMVLGAILVVIGFTGEDIAVARTSQDPQRRLYDIDDDEPVVRRRRI